MFEKRREEAEQRRKELLLSMTPTEKRFKRLLDKMSVRSYPQSVFFLDDDHYRIVDFYLPHPYRICIELDGSSHDSQRTKDYDAWKDKKLKTTHKRFRILRFCNDEVWEPSFYASLQFKLRRYYIKPHHDRFARKPWKPVKKKLFKYKHDDNKPRSNIINLGHQIVWESRKRECKYQGFTFQTGYTLKEMRDTGLLK